MLMRTRKMVFEGTEYEHTTPMRAIRAKCIDCCAGVVKEVRNCPCKDCELFPFRMGRNPFMGKIHQETVAANSALADEEEMEF